MIILSFVIIFHEQIQYQTTNLLFCIIYVLIRLPQHEIPKNNFCLNGTIFFCYHVVYCCVVGQKKCYRRPLVLSKTLKGWETLHKREKPFRCVRGNKTKCELNIVLSRRGVHFNQDGEKHLNFIFGMAAMLFFCRSPCGWIRWNGEMASLVTRFPAFSGLRDGDMGHVLDVR